MAIRSVVTRGYGNGTFNGTVPLVVLRGYAVGAPVFSGAIPDISVTENTGTHSYDLSTYFTGATSYSISPSVESGWSFNTSTAELIIDTDVVSSFGPYTVTGTNAGGSDSSNAFNVEVIAAEAEAASGGWWYAYDYEYEERKRKKKRLEDLEAKAEQIQDKIDRELAKELRKQEKEQLRLDELRRLSKLAQEHKEELEQSVSQKAIFAAEQAMIKGTYSAMERLERELAKAKEEELFLIQAASIILNS